MIRTANLTDGENRRISDWWLAGIDCNWVLAKLELQLSILGETLQPEIKIAIRNRFLMLDGMLVGQMLNDSFRDENED